MEVAGVDGSGGGCRLRLKSGRGAFSFKRGCAVRGCIESNYSKYRIKNGG